MENEQQALFHRRVQHKIADNYMKTFNIDPNIEEREQKLSESLTPETREAFEKQFGQYRKSNSPYSIQNVLWIMASIAVFYFSDFYLTILYDPKINRLWFNIGAILISINICIAIFLIVWLTYIKKVSSDDWEKKYPVAIPVATASFVFGGIFVMVGLWPVWNILTPVILFVLFMGFVVTIAMIPSI